MYLKKKLSCLMGLDVLTGVSTSDVYKKYRHIVRLLYILLLVFHPNNVNIFYTNSFIGPFSFSDIVPYFKRANLSASRSGRYTVAWPVFIPRLEGKFGSKIVIGQWEKHMTSWMYAILFPLAIFLLISNLYPSHQCLIF